MSKRAYLAFDLGAESGRAIVGILSDGKLELHELHRFLNTPQRLPHGIHWSLMDLWSNLLQGLEKAGRFADENDLELVSLGVDTWGVDFGLIGKSGQLMGLPFTYRDERNQPAMDKTVDKLGAKAIYAATGIQFMPFNSLFQLVAQHDAEPSLVDNADKLLFIPDLLHYFFSGKAVIESTIASTSQMIDPRSEDRGWATKLIEDAGLPTHLLGEIVQPGAKIGAILPQVAAEANVSESIQVVAPATHDTASAIAAVPAKPGADNWAYISSGTWSLMGVELPEPHITEAGREANITNEGGVDNTIRYLTNIAGLWLVQECRRYYEKQGITYDYNKLTQLAAEAEPFRTIVDPDHAPFIAPGRMPEKLAEFAKATNQPIPEEVGQFVRCCLESLALTYRHTLDKIESVLDRKYEVIHIVGGGGRNELLDQMTANATGCEVIVGPYEATAVGNLLVQAMGMGDVDGLAGIREVVVSSFDPKSFKPVDTADWDAAYERYLAIKNR